MVLWLHYLNLSFFHGHLVQVDRAVNILLDSGIAILVYVKHVLRRTRDAQGTAHTTTVAGHSFEEIGSLFLGSQQG